MRRRALLAASIGLLLALGAPLTAAAGGSVAEMREGRVLVGERGLPDDLDMSPDEFDEAYHRLRDLPAGIVTPDPAAPGSDARRTDAAVAAATRRLEAVGMDVPALHRRRGGARRCRVHGRAGAAAGAHDPRGR